MPQSNPPKELQRLNDLMDLQAGQLRGSRALVLIDPDSDEVLGTLARRLEMQGYAVTSTHDPAEGARQSLADPPAAVVADLWMTGISGVQLCRLLKTEPATENVPVVLRGPDTARNRFWAERAGASAYVVKGRAKSGGRNRVVVDPGVIDLPRPVQRVARDEVPEEETEPFEAAVVAG